MENQTNINTSNVRQTGQDLMSKPTPVSLSSKVNYFIIGGLILVCSSLSAFGGYYFGKQSNKNEQTYLQPSPSPIVTPSSLSTNTLPIGWSYKSGTCDVKFPIPPKEKPYYQPYDPNRTPSVTEDEGSGRYWQFRVGANSLFQFTNLETAMFANDEEASGYISGAVNVYCVENNDKYDSKQLLNQLNFFLVEGQGKIKIKSANKTTKWNAETYELSFEGGMFNSDQKYYLLATPSNWYLITTVSMSNTKLVQDTAQKIFDNLLFK